MADAAVAEAPAEERPSRSFWAELPVLVLIALVAAILIKTFLAQAFYIPSTSMLPTLEVNDRIMVNKLAYQFGEPDPGDIVVFESPFAVERSEPFLTVAVRTIAESVGIRTASLDDDLIKRVIAVGGQTVEIRSNRVFVDGEPLDEPYLSSGVAMRDMEPVTLGFDEVWVMGDNRNNSGDSRRFGPIEVGSLVGEAFVRLWPLDRFGGF